MKVKKYVKRQDGINIKDRREDNYQESLLGVVVDDGKLKVVVDLRIYGTKSKNYACVWVHDNKHDIHCSGSGSAGGYGYHRPSAAASEAFAKAGIEFDSELSGRGDSVMEHAVYTIMKKLYPRNKIVEVLRAHP